MWLCTNKCTSCSHAVPDHACISVSQLSQENKRRDHRDIIHRGSQAINLDTFKVKPDLSAPLPPKWLKFNQCVASHYQSISAVSSLRCCLCISCINTVSIKLSLFVQELIKVLEHIYAFWVYFLLGLYAYVTGH